MMELVAVKCENCKREIYMLENTIKEKMFCTLADCRKCGNLVSEKEDINCGYYSYVAGLLYTGV